MSNTILKPDPDQDFYVVWSDTNGGPAVWGTRAEVLDRMALPITGYTAGDRDPVRFDLADVTGTSLLAGEPFLGRVVNGRAWIARERMVDWCRSMLDARYLERTEDDRRRAAAADATDA